MFPIFGFLHVPCSSPVFCVFGVPHQSSVALVALVALVAPESRALGSRVTIIDFLNPEIWDDLSMSVISKEVILTLLHCAARLYEGCVHIKGSVALIENEDTRAILSLGIQRNLS